MKLFRRRSDVSTDSERIAEAQVRVKRYNDAELLDWAEQALFYTGRSLQGYRDGEGNVFLEEAAVSQEILKAALQELIERAVR